MEDAEVKRRARMVALTLRRVRRELGEEYETLRQMPEHGGALLEVSDAIDHVDEAAARVQRVADRPG